MFNTTDGVWLINHSLMTSIRKRLTTHLSHTYLILFPADDPFCDEEQPAGLVILGCSGGISEDGNAVGGREERICYQNVQKWNKINSAGKNNRSESGPLLLR